MVALHYISYVVAAICTAIASLISFRLAKLHLENFTAPLIQQCIIRILMMVPVYAVGSWLSLVFKDHALYIDLIRDCFEAVAIYSFVSMLREYAGGEANLLELLKKHGRMHHMFPLSLVYKDFVPDKHFLRRARQAVMQYVVIKPTMATLAIILDEMGLFAEGSFRLDRGYIYVTIISSLSVTIAMDGLLYIYHGVQDDIRDKKPLLKLLCIKGFLVVSFWQGIIVTILAKLNVIHQTKSYTVDEVETGLQDFLVCAEMILVALAHDVAYNYKEFALQSLTQNRRTTASKIIEVFSLGNFARDLWRSFFQSAEKDASRVK